MKKFVISILFVLTLFSCVSYKKPVLAEEIPLLNDDNHWRVIAASSEIFLANASELIADDVILNKYYKYNISVENVFKGAYKDFAQFSIYMKEDNYNYIMSLQGNEKVIIFLINTYDGYGNNNYLTDYFIDKSIIAYTEESGNIIEKEIFLQNHILENKLYENFNINKKTHNRIKQHINRTGNILFEYNTFRELEKNGMDGVPYIILLLDDFRKLSRRSIVLKNKSENAFERERHYMPELVIDALTAILNQITGENFGFIYNGEASQEERIRCLNGWRIYLYKLNLIIGKNVV